MLNIAKRLDLVLRKQFPNNEVAPVHFGSLLREYVESGLAPPHLISELETGEEGKLWSNLWEAMLFRHLTARGYELRNSVKAAGQSGPDFGVDLKGRTIWIEAIVPAPEGIDPHWLAPRQKGVVRAKTMPAEQMLLRVTAAVGAKRKKLDRYRKKGIIGEQDGAVIAVNINRLSDWSIDGKGISRFPFAVEAVLPIGPLAVPIDNVGQQAGPAQNMRRFSVRNAKGKDVRTDAFLDPKFASVSAVMQGHQKDMHQRDLALYMIHNPLAEIPIPTGLFGVQEEFKTTLSADRKTFAIQEI